MRNDLNSLPGAEIVLPGLVDLEAGRKSVNASAVQCAATRLKGLGLGLQQPQGSSMSVVLYASSEKRTQTSRVRQSHLLAALSQPRIVSACSIRASTSGSLRTASARSSS